MYTRRYIRAASEPMDRPSVRPLVRPTMYNVRRSCGVHRTTSQRFWRRIRYKVTESRSPFIPSSASRPATFCLTFHGSQAELLKVILPGVKAMRTSQKQYGFIAAGRNEREAEVAALVVFRDASAWHSSRKLATVS